VGELKLPAEGHCRCGRVRFRVTAPPMITMACHCTGCQRMSASAFSLTMMIPGDAFEVIQGETVIGGIHGDQGHHHHCDWCKSWMFTRVAFGGGIVNVRPTMLEDPGWFVPFAETYRCEALPWAKTPARHSFDKFPPPEQFGALIAEYAASRSGWTGAE
jgi:hypothetical protein